MSSLACLCNHQVNAVLRGNLQHCAHAALQAFFKTIKFLVCFLFFSFFVFVEDSFKYFLLVPRIKALQSKQALSVRMSTAVLQNQTVLLMYSPCSETPLKFIGLHCYGYSPLFSFQLVILNQFCHSFSELSVRLYMSTVRENLACFDAKHTRVWVRGFFQIKRRYYATYKCLSCPAALLLLLKQHCGF